MDVFAALGDPTRRHIIEMLARHELSASRIGDKFPVSHSAISQHLRVLREAKLVDMEKKAQKRIYKINPKAKDWIKKMMQLWNERFDRLDKILKPA